MAMTTECATTSLPDLQNLPPTLKTEQVAKLWGVSPWFVYELVRRGEAPVAPIHLGRSLRWPTARVLKSLGVGSEVAEVG
jgi:predicted DNA-binding transcriptional regulator AlpA